YCPESLRPILNRFPGRFAQALSARSAPGLSSRYVRSAFPAKSLLFRAARSVGHSTHFDQRWYDAQLGHEAALAVDQSKAAALVYNYYWPGFVRSLPDRASAGPLVLFQAHPLPHQVRRILQRDRAASDLPFALDDEEQWMDSEIEAY